MSFYSSFYYSSSQQSYICLLKYLSLNLYYELQTLYTTYGGLMTQFGNEVNPPLRCHTPQVPHAPGTTPTFKNFYFNMVFCSLSVFNLNKASGCHSAFIECCSQLNLLNFGIRFFINQTSRLAVNYMVSLCFASALVNRKTIIVQFDFLLIVCFQPE